MSRAPRIPRPRRSLLVTIIITAALALPAGVVLASHQFGDVPNSNPFHNDIAALVNTGVTAGCGGGNYCPKAEVTREQMAAFLNRLGALAPDKAPVVNAAKLGGYTANDFVRPLAAVVSGNGTLSRGIGVVSASRIGVQTGRYEVIFNRDVTNCVFTATIGDPSNGVATSGQISVANRSFAPAGVFVETNDSAGAPADRPFHLNVVCGILTLSAGVGAPGGVSPQDR